MSTGTISELFDPETGEMDQAAAEKMVDERIAKTSGETPVGLKKPAEPSKPTPGDGSKPAADDSAAKPKEPEPEKKPEPEPEQRDDEAVNAWMTKQDVKDILLSLNLQSTELEKFRDEDEFHRAVGFLDSQLSQEGKRNRAEGLGTPKEPPKEPAKEPESKPPERPRGEDGKFIAADQVPYKPTLKPDEIPGEVIEEFTKLHQHFEAREARLVARFQKEIEVVKSVVDQERQRRTDEVQRQAVAEFDRIVDSLGHPDLFGEAGKVAKGSAEWNNRVALWDHMADIFDGALLRGKPIELGRGIVLRALDGRFAKELKTKNQKALADNLRGQQRRQLGTSETSPAGEAPFKGDPKDDPFIRDYYKQVTAGKGRRAGGA